MPITPGSCLPPPVNFCRDLLEAHPRVLEVGVGHPLRAARVGELLGRDDMAPRQALATPQLLKRVRVLGRGTNGMAVLLRSAETGEMLVSKQLPAVGMAPAELEQVRNEVEAKLNVPSAPEYDRAPLFGDKRGGYHRAPSGDKRERDIPLIYP